jgi:YVTN family beta-propeller protein
LAAPTIFVSNEKDNTITVLNADTLETIKTIKVARRPRGIILSPATRSCSWRAATATSWT